MKGVLHVSSANKSAVYLNVICFNGHFLSFELSSFYAATIFSLSPAYVGTCYIHNSPAQKQGSY